jgi:sugar phosphate isomerase/epimerase
VAYPKLSISECTTYAATIEQDVAAYHAAGVEGIGIWEFKLPDGKDEQARDLIAQSGLVPTLCVPEVPSIIPDPFFAEPKDPRERRNALLEAVRRLAKFDPVAVMVLSGSPEGYDRAEMRRLVVDGLRAAAKVAADLGVTLGFEPLRQEAGSLTTTLPDSIALLDEIGAPNIKLISDTWHFWDTPDVVKYLAQYVDRIIGVQVNDWREPVRSWCDRVLPGFGKLDLGSFYRGLDEAGYNGWYDVEVFSDDGRFGAAYPDSLWAMEPDELARRAVNSFRSTWDAARVGR